MKAIKLSIRLWITGAATLSFLAGWAFFANSNKPAPLTTVSSTTDNASQSLQSAPQTLPTNPRQRFGGFQNSQSQFSQTFPSYRPRFRTGGS